MLSKAIQEAMKHPNILGAGAKKRKKLNDKDHFAAVMKEFKRGTLHSGSGAIVTSEAQAKKIALEEIRAKHKKSIKKGDHYNT